MQFSQPCAVTLGDSILYSVRNHLARTPYSEAARNCCQIKYLWRYISIRTSISNSHLKFACLANFTGLRIFMGRITISQGLEEGAISQSRGRFRTPCEFTMQNFRTPCENSKAFRNCRQMEYFWRYVAFRTPCEISQGLRNSSWACRL